MFTQEEHEEAQEGDTSLDKKLDELRLNGLEHEDFILSINTNSTIGKIVFGLMRNAKSLDFPEGNCKITMNQLVNKHASYIASSLLKLRNEFPTSKLN